MTGNGDEPDVDDVAAEDMTDEPDTGADDAGEAPPGPPETRPESGGFERADRDSLLAEMADDPRRIR